MLISVQDALDFHRMLDSATEKGELHEGRKLLLIRPGLDIKALREQDQEEVDAMQNDPEARKLIAQALLFANKHKILNQRQWIDVLENTLPKGDERLRYSDFFEEKVLGTISTEYETSKLFNVLRSRKEETLKKRKEDISRKSRSPSPTSSLFEEGIRQTVDPL